MKLRIHREDKYYDTDFGEKSPNWIRSHDGEGWVMSEDDEIELHASIFSAIDKFFMENM